MFPPQTRILIVDDDPSLRFVSKTHLQGFPLKNISEVGDGASAYQALLTARLDQWPFELVISDFNMPKMNGLELLKIVRASPEIKSLPFILLTTDDGRETIVSALHSGVSQYLIKPVNPVILREKLVKIWKERDQA